MDFNVSVHFDSLKTRSSLPNISPKSVKVANKPITTYKWAPMGHQCGVCKKAIKRRCMTQEHMEVCFGYHETLMMFGHAEDCRYCQHEKRVRDEKQADIDAAVRQGNLRAKSKAEKVKHDWERNTEHEKNKRRKGFEESKWNTKASSSDSDQSYVEC
ncbi:hypothetical protein BZA77DRAFT_353178 [Pyronema omphalodes]|nr:hypothetical protein BZA77DRAFT_353178 [Pyronema omphalodes]